MDFRRVGGRKGVRGVMELGEDDEIFSGFLPLHAY